MPTGIVDLRHIFEGGWATDLGPNVDVLPDQTGLVRIPFLWEADDVVFEFDGGPRKCPGTSQLSALLESGATIKGLYDCWFSGTGGSSTQHRICHVGTKIKKDDADGTFTDIFTGMTAGSVPAYSMLEDLLVMSNENEVPKSWDGTTAQNLAGSPPAFAFSIEHKNRLWAAGVASNPSRLYYSVLLDPADWAGAGSGSIDISPDDGDRITAIISHKNELWVFKGPYKGSIHRITGSAPTGDDAFARKTFINGIGSVGHNTLFRFRDDVGFMWSDGSIRSLKATDAFGDFNEAALSRDIATWIREHVTFNALKNAWAATDDNFGQVLFALPVDASTDPNIVLCMDYRFNPVRWSKWPSFNTAATCVASVVDSASSNRRIIMGGGSDGYVRKFGQVTRSIDGSTPLSYKWTTPFMSYGQRVMLKTLYDGSIGFAPKNTGSVTFGWQRDDNSQQTIQVSQSGSGAALGSFTLGTSTLAGSQFADRFFDLVEGGEFRSAQFQVTNAVGSEDVEIHSFNIGVKETGRSLEN